MPFSDDIVARLIIKGVDEASPALKQVGDEAQSAADRVGTASAQVASESQSMASAIAANAAEAEGSLGGIGAAAQTQADRVGAAVAEIKAYQDSLKSPGVPLHGPGSLEYASQPGLNFSDRITALNDYVNATQDAANRMDGYWRDVASAERNAANVPQSHVQQTQQLTQAIPQTTQVAADALDIMAQHSVTSSGIIKRSVSSAMSTMESAASRMTSINFQSGWAADAIKGISDVNTSYDNLARRGRLAATDLATSTNTIGNLLKNVGTSVGALGTDWVALQKHEAASMASINTSVSKENERIKAMGKEKGWGQGPSFPTAAGVGVGAVGLGAGAIAGIAAIVGTIMDMRYQTSTHLVEAFTNTTPGVGQRFAKNMLTEAPQYGVTPNSGMQALYSILSAGPTPASSNALLKQSLMLAGSSQTPIQQVTQALTQTFMAYNMKQKDIPNLSNAIAAGVNLGSMTMQNLIQALPNVTPMASREGVSINDLMALFATSTNRGLDAQQTGQDTANMLTEMMRPGPEATKYMRALGLNRNDFYNMPKTGFRPTMQNWANLQQRLMHEKPPTFLQIENAGVSPKAAYNMEQQMKSPGGILLGLLGGSTAALKQFSLLFPSTDPQGQLFHNYEQGTQKGQIKLGTQHSWNIMKGNPAMEWHKTVAEMQAAGIVIGQSIEPEVNKLLSDVAKAAQELGKWVSHNQALVAGGIKWGLIAGGVGAVTIAVSLLHKQIGGVIKDFLSMEKNLFRKGGKDPVLAGLKNAHSDIIAKEKMENDLINKQYEGYQRITGELKRQLTLQDALNNKGVPVPTSIHDAMHRNAMSTQDWTSSEWKAYNKYAGFADGNRDLNGQPTYENGPGSAISPTGIERGKPVPVEIADPRTGIVNTAPPEKVSEVSGVHGVIKEAYGSMVADGVITAANVAKKVATGTVTVSIPRSTISSITDPITGAMTKVRNAFSRTEGAWSRSGMANKAQEAAGGTSYAPSPVVEENIPTAGTRKFFQAVASEEGGAISVAGKTLNDNVAKAGKILTSGATKVGETISESSKKAWSTFQEQNAASRAGVASDAATVASRARTASQTVSGAYNTVTTPFDETSPKGVRNLRAGADLAAMAIGGYIGAQKGGPQGAVVGAMTGQMVGSMVLPYLTANPIALAATAVLGGAFGIEHLTQGGKFLPGGHLQNMNANQHIIPGDVNSPTQAQAMAQWEQRHKNDFSVRLDNVLGINPADTRLHSAINEARKRYEAHQKAVAFTGHSTTDTTNFVKHVQHLQKANEAFNKHQNHMANVTIGVAERGLAQARAAGNKTGAAFWKAVLDSIPKYRKSVEKSAKDAMGSQIKGLVDVLRAIDPHAQIKGTPLYALHKASMGQMHRDQVALQYEHQMWMSKGHGGLTAAGHAHDMAFYQNDIAQIQKKGFAQDLVNKYVGHDAGLERSIQKYGIVGALNEAVKIVANQGAKAAEDFLQGKYGHGNIHTISRRIHDQRLRDAEQAHLAKVRAAHPMGDLHPRGVFRGSEYNGGVYSPGDLGRPKPLSNPFNGVEGWLNHHNPFASSGYHSHAATLNLAAGRGGPQGPAPEFSVGNILGQLPVVSGIINKLHELQHIKLAHLDLGKILGSHVPNFSGILKPLHELEHIKLSHLDLGKILGGHLPNLTGVLKPLQELQHIKLSHINLGQIFGNASKTIGDALHGGLVIAQGFRPKLIGIFNTLPGPVKGALSAIGPIVTGAMTSLLTLMGQGGLSAITGFATALTNPGLIASSVGADVAAAIAAFASSHGQFLTAGASLATSIASGISSEKTAIWNALQGVVGDAMKNLGSFIKHHMPKITLPFGLGGGGAMGGGGWDGNPASLGMAFGLPNGGFHNSGEESGNYGMYKSLGIGYTGSLQDWDYATRPGGVGVSLPGTSSTDYKYLRSAWMPGMGTAEFFQTPNGGVFNTNHMQSTGGLKAGQIVTGGTYIGQSGEPLMAPYNGGLADGTPDWHLCIVTDAKGRTFLASVSGSTLSAAIRNGQSMSSLSGVPGAVSQYSSIINDASKKYGIPTALLASQIYQESKGAANASSPGADGTDVGLMQYGPNEAAAVGGQYTYNPQGNIMTGAAYLKSLYNGPAKKNWAVALRMYNAGAGATGKGLQEGNTYAQEVINRAAGYAGNSGGGGAVGSGAFAHDNNSVGSLNGPVQYGRFDSIWGPFHPGTAELGALNGNIPARSDYLSFMHNVEALPQGMQQYLGPTAQKLRQDILKYQQGPGSAAARDTAKYNQAKADIISKAGWTKDQYAQTVNHALSDTYQRYGIHLTATQARDVVNSNYGYANLNASIARIRETAAAAGKSGGSSGLTTISPQDAKYFQAHPEALVEYMAQNPRLARRYLTDLTPMERTHITKSLPGYVDLIRKGIHNDPGLFNQINQGSTHGGLTPNQRIALLEVARGRVVQHTAALAGISAQTASQALGMSVSDASWKKITEAAKVNHTTQTSLHKLFETYYGPGGKIPKDNQAAAGAWTKLQHEIHTATSAGNLWKNASSGASAADTYATNALSERMLEGKSGGGYLQQAAAARGMTLKMQDASDKAALAIATATGDWQGMLSGVAKTASLAADHLSVALYKGKSPTAALAEAAKAANSQERMATASDQAAMMIGLVTGNLGQFSQGISNMLGHLNDNLVQGELRGRVSNGNIARQASLENTNNNVAALTDVNKALVDLSSGSVKDLSSSLGAVNTHLQDDLINQLVASKGINQSEMNSIIAINDGLLRLQVTTDGLSAVQAAASGSLDAMGKSAQSLATDYQTQWEQQGTVWNALTPKLLQAADAAAAVAHAQSLQSVTIGEMTGNASMISTGLSNILGEATNGMQYFTTMIGRDGDNVHAVIGNFTTLSANALTAANSLGSLSDIVSGINNVVNTDMSNGSTEFARTGLISNATYQSLYGAGGSLGAQSGATADQVASDLLLNRNPNNPSQSSATGYGAALDAAVTFAQNKMNDLTASGQTGTDAYKTLATELPQLLSEQKYFKEGQSANWNVANVPTADQAGVTEALTMFRTQGLTPAEQALMPFTTLIKTGTSSQQAYQDATKTAQQKVADLGTEAAKTATDLKTLLPLLKNLAKDIASGLKPTTMTVHAGTVVVDGNNTSKTPTPVTVTNAKTYGLTHGYDPGATVAPPVNQADPYSYLKNNAGFTAAVAKDTTTTATNIGKGILDAGTKATQGFQVAGKNITISSQQVGNTIVESVKQGGKVLGSAVLASGQETSQTFMVAGNQVTVGLADTGNKLAYAVQTTGSLAVGALTNAGNSIAASLGTIGPSVGGAIIAAGGEAASAIGSAVGSAIAAINSAAQADTAAMNATATSNSNNLMSLANGNGLTTSPSSIGGGLAALGLSNGFAQPAPQRRSGGLNGYDSGGYGLTPDGNVIANPVTSLPTTTPPPATTPLPAPTPVGWTGNYYYADNGNGDTIQLTPGQTWNGLIVGPPGSSPSSWQSANGSSTPTTTNSLNPFASAPIATSFPTDWQNPNLTAPTASPVSAPSIPSGSGAAPSTPSTPSTPSGPTISLSDVAVWSDINKKLLDSSALLHASLAGGASVIGSSLTSLTQPTQNMLKAATLGVETPAKLAGAASYLIDQAQRETQTELTSMRAQLTSSAVQMATGVNAGMAGPVNYFGQAVNQFGSLIPQLGSVITGAVGSMLGSLANGPGGTSTGGGVSPNTGTTDFSNMVTNPDGSKQYGSATKIYSGPGEMENLPAAPAGYHWAYKSGAPGNVALYPSQATAKPYGGEMVTMERMPNGTMQAYTSIHGIGIPVTSSGQPIISQATMAAAGMPNATPQQYLGMLTQNATAAGNTFFQMTAAHNTAETLVKTGAYTQAQADAVPFATRNANGTWTQPTLTPNFTSYVPGTGSYYPGTNTPNPNTGTPGVSLGNGWYATGAGQFEQPGFTPTVQGVTGSPITTIMKWLGAPGSWSASGDILSPFMSGYTQAANGSMTYNPGAPIPAGGVTGATGFTPGGGQVGTSYGNWWPYYNGVQVSNPYAASGIDSGYGAAGQNLTAVVYNAATGQITWSNGLTSQASGAPAGVPVIGGGGMVSGGYSSVSPQYGMGNVGAISGGSTLSGILGGIKGGGYSTLGSVNPQYGMGNVGVVGSSVDPLTQWLQKIEQNTASTAGNTQQLVDDDTAKTMAGWMQELVRLEKANNGTRQVGPSSDFGDFYNMFGLTGFGMLAQ